MTNIVFETISPETPATGSAALPRLRAHARTTGTFVGMGILPRLRQTRASVVQPPQRLPALRAAKFAGTFDTGQNARALPRLRAHARTTGTSVGMAVLPRLSAFGSASDTTPQITLGYGTLPKLKVSGEAKFEMASTGDATLPNLKAFGLTGDNTVVGAARLPALEAYGYVNNDTGGTMSMVQSPGYAYVSGSATDILLLGDGLQMGGTIDAKWIQVLQDRLRILDTPTTLLEALDKPGETLTFRDVVGIGYALLVQESVKLGGTPTANLRHALELADALAMTSGVGSVLDAQVTAATAFALADAIASVYPSALADGIDLGDVVATTLKATMELMDAMRLSGTATPGVTWLVVSDDTLALDDGLSSTATLNALLADGLELLGEIRLEDGAYLAWVVNTETRGFVKYRNYPFNSFAKVGKRYFGATGDGIYELAGDDDAGEPIEAVLRGGLVDLASTRLKGHPSAYIGYRGDDVMVLRVTVVNDDGEREEHWYQMEDRPARGGTRVTRVKIGRGLKSTYWGWELNNVGGADFDVDSFSWYPIILERRLN